MGNSIGQQIEGKHVFLAEKYCDSDELENPLLRVYLATGGNGCSPNTIGTAVFATQIATQISIRLEGYMLERLATKKEIKAATKLYKDDPPLDKRFTHEDIVFDEKGRPRVHIKRTLIYDVALYYKYGDAKIRDSISMTMTYEGVMNSYVGWVIRDIKNAVENNEEIDAKEIRKQMVDFAKGWLGKEIAGLIQSPIEITVDLKELSAEEQQKFIKHMSDTQRLLLAEHMKIPEA